MQKILLAVDAAQVNMAALDFACYLARLTKSDLTGVFLENLVSEEKPVLNEAGIPHLDWRVDTSLPEYKEKILQTEKNISFFKDACSKREINCHIHRDRGEPSKEIIRESRFADLVIIDANTSFKTYDGLPTEFVKDVLKNTECPVVVAPENADTVIDEIVFTYDGSKASMFAIRQFGYLFPGLKTKNVTLLEVTPATIDDIHQKYKVKEWLRAHYINCDCKTLDGDVKDQLFSFLLAKKNAFIVMGSYGRSGISNFFRRSNADIILKTTSLPVFITHP